jgi:di/tricarboxylate transporter
VTLSIAAVLLLFGLTVVVLAFEWLAVEVYSLLLILALVLLRILTPREAFLGFADPSVIMIAGIMLLTGGIIHNGAADLIAMRIRKLAGASEARAGAFLLLAVNAVSSVINNVAATAMFIPVAEGMAHHFRVHRGKYLMSVAFASMTGGMCTLIGTSTNVAVAGAMERMGLRPLGMFELSPVGAAVALLGLPYLLWVAPRLLRLAAEVDELEAFDVKKFLYEIVVGPEAPVVGRTLAEADLGRRYGLHVLAIVRGDEQTIAPHGDDVIHAGDLLLVNGESWTIPAVQGVAGLQIKSLPELPSFGRGTGRTKVMEATLSFNSPFLGRSLQEVQFRHRYDLSVLAIHRRAEVLVDKVGKIPLRAGDVLLVYGREEMLERLAGQPTMLLVETQIFPRGNPARAWLAAGILLLAIASAAAGWLDAPLAFLAGAALVLALQCVPPEQAGSYLNVRFLVLLAGMATLGLAMETSGAAHFLAEGIVDALPSPSPILLLAVFFALTVGLTQPLNNAAAALLVLPIAVHAAAGVGADPRALAVAVTIAASCSFVTPFEPACLLVYGTGRYRFADFPRVGALLTLLAFGASLLIVPRLWPF